MLFIDLNQIQNDKNTKKHSFFVVRIQQRATEEKPQYITVLSTRHIRLNNWQERS